MKNVNILKDLNTLNKLHASSVKSHTTNNGIVDFTCDNAGYVDNVVIEGKTLVNLIRTNLSVEVWDNNRVAINLQDCNYLEGTYTLFNFSDKTIVFDIGEATTNNWLRTFALDANKVKTFNINNGERIFNVNGLFANGWENNDTSKNKFRNSIVLLEGDHTDKPISYFEGLKSVGQGDKIEVLTYNKTNNLIEDTFTYTKDVAINYINGEFRSVTGHYACDNYIKIEPSTDYMFVGINANRAYYDENKQVVPPINNSYLQILLDKTNGSKKNFAVEKSPPNARYIKISIHKDNLVGGKAYLYKSSNYDHKQIPTTLRSLPNGVKDTIEKRGNKYVKVQRCGEHTYNGEDFYYYASNDAIHHAQINLNNIKTYADTNIPNVISNLIPHQSNASNGHCKIFIEGSKINIILPTLSYTDEDSIKNYLKDNNFTVVYELEKPIITELPNFNPQTYKGDNTLLINSGVIQCDASFDVCEGIRSELDVIKNKVSSLDDTTTTINYRNLRDDITFLNGWNIWGNEARFNCYVADNIVKICILLKPSVLTQYTPIFKLPAQYITGRKEFVTCVDNNMRCYMGSLDETCMFTFENEISSESKYVSINFTYPLIKKVI